MSAASTARMPIERERRQMNYLAMSSQTKQEFHERIESANHDVEMRDNTPDEVRKIENLLDLTEGSLSHIPFRSAIRKCSCGHNISFYDAVFTVLVEQIHEPSFIVHCLFGRKYFINKPSAIRCSSCGLKESTDRYSEVITNDYYETPKYGCCW
jgi:hypothetical protein